MADTPARKRVPANAPKPQDHKPKLSTAAREAEAGDGFVTITQCGMDLKVPIKGKIPLKAVLKFREGDHFEGTRLLLGDEQWDAFLAADPTLDDFAEVGNKLDEAAGN